MKGIDAHVCEQCSKSCLPPESDALLEALLDKIDNNKVSFRELKDTVGVVPQHKNRKRHMRQFSLGGARAKSEARRISLDPHLTPVKEDITNLTINPVTRFVANTPIKLSKSRYDFSPIIAVKARM